MIKELFALVAGALFAHNMSIAAELTVLSGGAVEPGLHAAVAAFENETGHHVSITFNTTPQIAKRIGAGEVFDVIVAPPNVMDTFAKEGKVAAGRVNIGRVGLGMIVRPGAPIPDISSADAFKRSVLDAESIVFNRASTGIYFENLLKKIGVYEQVEGKSTRYPDGASVMEHVANGKGKEIGFGAITEIMLFKDKVRFVGPLPAEVQNYTSYAAARMAASTSADAAKRLVQFLGTKGKPMFVAAGIE